MKYILATIITISIAYTGYKATEKLCELLDKFVDYLERKRKNE